MVALLGLGAALGAAVPARGQGPRKPALFGQVTLGFVPTALTCRNCEWLTTRGGSLGGGLTIVPKIAVGVEGMAAFEANRRPGIDAPPVLQHHRLLAATASLYWSPERPLRFRVGIGRLSYRLDTTTVTARAVVAGLSVAIPVDRGTDVSLVVNGYSARAPQRGYFGRRAVQIGLAVTRRAPRND